ncbi:MAG: UxaA family hydrolase [Acidobacteriota bacterium]
MSASLTFNYARIEVALPDGRIIGVKAAVRPGHRFATRRIEPGEFVLQFGHPIGTSLGIEEGNLISHDNMSNAVPHVRDLPQDLFTPPPDYIPEHERATFMGFRRADNRVGTRNYVLIVPTSMCASHEAQQISMMSEFMLYKREKLLNVDGVVAIPHNKGCGCQDGSNIEVMLRTLANYADHPNVGAVILIDLGCEKTNLAKVEKYLLRREQSFNKPVSRIGIQEAEGYHPNVAAPGGQINFLWMMVAMREGEDRQFGVVNVQPEFASSGSGLEAVRGK